MVVGKSGDYSNVLSSLQSGRFIDVDKKGNFVVSNSKWILWKHVYDPQTYAKNVLLAIDAKLEESGADQKENLLKLADNVSAEYRVLTHENRLSAGKAKVISVLSKFVHMFHKSTVARQEVVDLFSKVQRKCLISSEVSPQASPEALNQHRNPSEAIKKNYTGQNNVTAAQNKYLGILLNAAPKDWEVMASGSNNEKRLAEALILDVEQKMQERTLAWTAAVRLPDSELKTKLVMLAGDENKTMQVVQLLKLLKPDDQNAIIELLKAQAKKQSMPLAELVNMPLQDRVKDLKNDDYIKAIAIARLKEVAARQAYRLDLPGKIQEGNYNPAVIKAEICKELKVGAYDPVPLGMQSLADVKEELKLELERIRQVPGIGLTKEQARYIRHDASHLLDLYVKAYPNKTHAQQYVLARDMIRAVVYQEMHDKSSFTGSDHGAKHVHHNTENADGLHEHMQKGDYTAKDQFLEHLIHAYHDMGYTVGLGATNFDCCKDHPFIGAKMIEDNRSYFEDLLDKESCDVLQDSILCHAIAVFDMTPDVEQTNGIHRNMVRAVTSISDACAVTYDRKTQEFWEQPGALIALSRLKLFLTQYPVYKSILSDPKIIVDEWAGLDKNNIMDKMAHDIFKGTKERLLNLADAYTLAPDRAALFKQAINSQFNAFTANTTLGQYGAVLTGVEAVDNDGALEGGPKYLPQFNMAPSIMYGVLKDLFGQDQANDAFNKLVAEAGGNLKDIQGEIERMGKALGKKEQPIPMVKKTGLAFFNIHAHTDLENPVRSRDKAYIKHMKHLQRGLLQATNAVKSIYTAAQMTPVEKAKMFSDLEKIRKGDEKMSFQEFLAQLAAAIPVEQAASQETRWLPILENATTFDEKIKSCAELEKGFRANFESLRTILTAQLNEKAAHEAVIKLVEAYRQSDFIRHSDNAVGKLLTTEPYKSLDSQVFEEIERNVASNKGEYIRNEQSYRRIKDAMAMLLMTNKEYDFMMAASKEPAPSKEYFQHI